MSVRLCSKAGKHAGRQVEALCLEEDCRKDRLLCFFCVFESHAGHQIAYLHRQLKGPVCNLYQQALTAATARASRERLEATFVNIGSACERLGRTAKSRLGNVRGQLAPQMEAIRRSFRKNSVDEILRDLTSSVHLSPEKVEKYVSILRFYHSNVLADFDKLERNSLLLWEALSGLIEQATLKLEMVFADLDALVAGVDLTGDLPFPHPRPLPADATPQLILEQKTAENMEILREEDFEVEAEQQDPVEQAAEVEQEAVEEKIEAEPNEEVLQPLEVEQIVTNPPVQVEVEVEVEAGEVLEPVVAAPVEKEQGSGEGERPISEACLGTIEQEKEGVIDQFVGKEGTRMVIKAVEGPRFPLQQPSAEDNEWQPGKVEAVEKCERTLRKAQGPRIDAVFITAASPHELNRMLGRVEAEGVRTLVIRCDTRLDILNAESVAAICQMRRLTSLRVYMACRLTEWMAIDLLKSLRLLQELVLADFAHLTPRVVDVIKTYNINLSRVCFASDMRSLRSAEEALEFLPDITEGVREEEQWQSLTESALLLSTLELQNASNHAYWVNYLRNCGHALREVTITQTGPHNQDFTHLLRALAKCRGIECLRLEMLQFEEDALLEVINSNAGLQVFVMSECPSVSARTYRCLFKYAPALRALSLNLEDKFNAKHACLAKNLEVLIVRGCYGVTEINFCGLLASLKNLKSLSVNYADAWLGRNAIWEISKLKSLQVLNISHNKNCLHPFGLKCLKLRTFICSNNGLSYAAFTDHSFTNSIEKLSISGIPTENGKELLDLDLLRFFFPRLTHLKAVNYERLSTDASRLEEHKHLISIVVGDWTRKEDVEDIRFYCSRRRVNFLCLDD